MSTAKVEAKTPDGDPVPLTRATIRTDMDSWCWELTATVAAPSPARRVVPTADGPGEIEVYAQGFRFDFLVERYRLTREHARTEYEIEGRSRSAWLDEPHAPTRARQVDDDRQAIQLALDELEYIDGGAWDVDWQIANWLVPGGVYRYNERTPIAAIGWLAEAAGGFILSHRHRRELIVRPRYPEPVPDWPDADAAEIPRGDILRETARRKADDRFALAWVMGDSSQGVIVRGYRAAWDTLDEKRTAPPQAHSLVTDREVGRELARYRIDQSGPKEQAEITTPLRRASDDPDALLQPGDLLRLTGDDEPDVTGLVTGTIIEAEQGDDGPRIHRRLEAELRPEEDGNG